MAITPKARAIISLGLSLVMLTVLVTSVLMYLFPYDRTTAAIHTLFGISLLSLIGFHLRNNFTPLGNYFSNQRRWLWVNSSLAVVILLGAFLWLPPFSKIIEFGEDMRQSNSLEAGRYDILSTRGAEGGLPVRILVRAGEHYTSETIELLNGWITFVTVPQMAIWVESADGEFLGTLYLTSKASDSSYETIDIFSDTVVRRPEALPIWSHRRGVKSEDGLYMPGPKNPIGDATAAATPVADYELNSALPLHDGPVKLYMEVNRSFDFNDFFHPKAFPDDPVYSGQGNSGQPSVLYSLELDPPTLDAERRFAAMKLEGQGHYSGADGAVYPIKGLSTGLELIDIVLVEVNPPYARTRD